jgi:uncharacterized protein (TIGR02246 family)
MTIVTSESISPTIDALNAAWNSADPVAFSEQCVEDVDFINLLGMHAKGRAAVARMHDVILRGPYANSTLRFSIEGVRVLSPEAVVAIVPGDLRVPAGPVAGTILTVATVVFVRHGAGWRVANFQNTKRESTQANLISIMADTHATAVAPTGS